MNPRHRNVLYGFDTDLIFDLADLKFKRREKRFLPDNEMAVCTMEGIHGYTFRFSRLRDGKLEFLDVLVSEFNLPYANEILDAHAGNNGFSVERDPCTLVISEEKYNKIKEQMK